jgi:hypothetical protein
MVAAGDAEAEEALAYLEAETPLLARGLPGLQQGIIYFCPDQTPQWGVPCVIFHRNQGDRGSSVSGRKLFQKSA